MAAASDAATKVNGIRRERSVPLELRQCFSQSSLRARLVDENSPGWPRDSSAQSDQRVARETLGQALLT